MIARRPHGGEVFGASPNNRLLVPALSSAPYLSMSPQQQMLDRAWLYSLPGLIGDWDPAQSCYTTAGDTTPAAVGSPVGVMYAAGSGLVPIPADGLSFATVRDSGGSSGSVASRVFNNSVAGSVYYYPEFCETVSLVSPTKVVVSIIRLLAVFSGPTEKITSLSANAGAVNPGFPRDGGTFYGTLTVGLATQPARLGLWTDGRTTWSGLTLEKLDLWVNNGVVAWQDTTANKPILRRTPVTGKYWLDADSTDALNITLPAQLTNCAIFRTTAEGVTVSRAQTVTTTYNILTPYSYNGRIVIVNEAVSQLTDSDVARITRMLAASVPTLGPTTLINGTFDSGTSGWAAYRSATVSVSDGQINISANGVSYPGAYCSTNTIVNQYYLLIMTKANSYSTAYDQTGGWAPDSSLGSGVACYPRGGASGRYSLVSQGSASSVIYIVGGQSANPTYVFRAEDIIVMPIL